MSIDGDRTTTTRPIPLGGMKPPESVEIPMVDAVANEIFYKNLFCSFVAGTELLRNWSHRQGTFAFLPVDAIAAQHSIGWW